jgi:chromosomal replication initiation ATPase DnaA
LNAVCDVTSLWTRLRVHVVFNRNWPTAEEWVDWVRPFEKTCYRTSIDGKRVVERVCDVFKVSMEDLQGPSRKRTVADARRVLVLFLRELALMSFQEIGTLLDRHHSTIMHLLEGTAERTQTDALFARQLEFIREGLKK